MGSGGNRTGKFLTCTTDTTAPALKPFPAAPEKGKGYRGMHGENAGFN
jgi:hypothetical protein